MLKGIRKTFLSKVKLSSIVSMSDDGRTTGRLMKTFEKEKKIYFPPPGDLRKCLYALSTSKYAKIFEVLLETPFKSNHSIKEFYLFQYFHAITVQILQTQESLFGDDIGMMKDFFKRQGEFYDDLKEML
jgi:2-phospho-L-lactate transferase/gluconeogenesis factor (CofD/UPF0052 family)